MGPLGRRNPSWCFCMSRIAFAFLADFALAHPDGKFYVVGGGFDALFGTAFPIVHSQLSLTVKVEFKPTECDRQHVIEVVALNADGVPFMPTWKMDVLPRKNAAEPTVSVGIQVVLNIQGLKLEKAGDYAFSILIDGEERESVPLRVRQLPEGVPWVSAPGRPPI